MIILGLNGRIELEGRVDGHDASACLFVDGRMVAAVEEERFTRVRHAPGGAPRMATRWCLESAGVAFADVDVVALGWDPFRQVDYSGPRTTTELLECLLPEETSRLNRRDYPNVEIVRHHVAHAAGAFFASPFEEAACLVVDGAGEQESISWFHCDGESISLRGERPVAASLGFFYSALANFVGLGRNAEGKVMGLAPYGASRLELPSPLAMLPAGPSTLANNDIIVERWVDTFSRVSGVQPNENRWIHQNGGERDVSSSLNVFTEQHLATAASAQMRLNRDMLALAREALISCGSDNLVLSGGVGLNCTANGFVAQHLSPGQRLWVQPSANDAGVAIGAAAYIAWQSGNLTRLPADHVYSGPAVDRGAVADLLRHRGVTFVESESPELDLAKALATDHIIARFEGAAEFGPRALGNRSILANPTSTAMRDRVNEVKRREPWRPLAPSLPFEQEDDLFEELDSDAYKHMLVTAPVRPDARSAVAGVVHVDGTTRPQLVSPAENATYHRLLKELYQEHGIPAVMNTSLNIESPIVNTADDALELFMKADIDVLAIEGLIVWK